MTIQSKLDWVESSDDHGLLGHERGFSAEEELCQIDDGSTDHHRSNIYPRQCGICTFQSLP